MGVSILLVRFPDGAIKFGSYQNTADVPNPKLADTYERALELHGDFKEPVHTEPEVAVEIYCCYGGGFFWYGKARGNFLTETGYDPEHYGVTSQDGAPSWVPEEWC